MSELLFEKLGQASRLVAKSPFDVWITFVRETAESGDPVLPYLIDGSLTWLSALIVAKSGRRVAVVGHYDGDAIEASGNWDQVIRYHQDIQPALLSALESLCPVTPNIGVNFSVNDEKCDGLTHGLYLTLEKLLNGSRFEGSLGSAEEMVMALRGRKTPLEVERMKGAIREGDRLFEEIQSFAKVGVTELEVYNFVHKLVSERGLGFSWDPVGDPIVNSGPHSMIGHGLPSAKISIQEGHIFHIDLGVVKGGYSSDIQRSWFVGTEIPEDALQGFQAVRTAILAGFEVLKPGALGWEVDLAARNSLVASGYAEFMHAFGHQVGRVAHDGGALLGPKWERYGNRPLVPISENEVYTLELGVELPGRGYLGLEEMALVTREGALWLSNPQTKLWVLKP